MNSLDERFLYCDFDFVVFTSRHLKNDYVPATGKCLGQLTDEIRDVYGTNAYGYAFVTLGAKTYRRHIKVADNQ